MFITNTDILQTSFNDHVLIYIFTFHIRVFLEGGGEVLVEKLVY